MVLLNGALGNQFQRQFYAEVFIWLCQITRKDYGSSTSFPFSVFHACSTPPWTS
jgi:hypothetical protein